VSRIAGFSRITGEGHPMNHTLQRVTLAALLVAPAAAHAQTPPLARPPHLDFAATLHSRPWPPDERRLSIGTSNELADRVRSLSARPRIRTRKTLGAILGALGGFYAGGAVGFALDRNCRGDDCRLEGGFYGAAVGAIAGGFFGAWLASR